MGKASNPFVPVASTEATGRKIKSGNGESLGRQLDFYTIRTLLDITPGDFGSASQDRLNRIIEVIGTRAQPIIVSVETASTETSPSDLPAATGSVSVFTLKFALEHVGAWEGTTPTLAQSLNGIAGFVSVGTDPHNVVVTRFGSL